MMMLAASAAAMAAHAQDIGPGDCLAFTNSSQYVTFYVPYPPANTYTISAWVFLTAGGKIGQPVSVLGGSCGSTAEVWIHSLTSSTADPQYMELARCGKFGGNMSTIIVPTNQWVHLAVTVDANNNVSYFINGVAAGGFNGSGYNLALGSPLMLADNHDQMFYGFLDEVRIWNLALSQADIQATMYSSLTGNQSDLLAYFRFDDGAGTTATNASSWTGSECNASLAGSPAPSWVQSTAPIGVPAVSSPQEALDVGSNTATLTALVSPFYQTNGAQFRYGTNLNFGSSNAWSTVHGGLAFDGATGSVNMNAAVIPTNGNFTVECWAQLPTATSGPCEILSQGASGNAFYIGTYQGNIRAGDTWNKTPVAFPVGGWHHFAVVKSSTNTTLYVDGVSKASLGHAIPNPGSSTPFRLGRQYGPTYVEYWPGQIDEVRVWSAAVDQATIQNWMWQGVTSSHPYYTNLAGYWSLNDGSGTNVADLSGAGNTGMIVSNVTWVAGQSLSNEVVGCQVSGLIPGTTYFYQTVATNTAGETFGPTIAFGNGSSGYVYSLADNGPGSLRQMLASAANGGIINFLVSGAITLTSGQLNVPNSVSILGPGAGLLTVSGNNTSGVFNITGSNVTISGLTIANGQTTSDGAGIYAGGGPGSSLAISSCVVTNNSTTHDGGGICNYSGETMTVSNCTICGNSAKAGNGAGIYNTNATLTVVASTFIGNEAAFGGGIMNDGPNGANATLTVLLSTFSANSAAFGGGIFNWGDHGSATLNVSASTFSGNSATIHGGGIYNEGEDGGNAPVQIGDTILNANVGASFYNDEGTIISDGYNLSSDDGGGFLSQTGDQINTDPLLGPLQDNGGPTWTCALLPGSPAIDQGKTNAVPGLVCATDQRGSPRPVDNPYIANAPGGDGSDIGAFEVQCVSVTNTADSGPGSLRAAVANSASGFTITFAPALSGQTILLTSGQITLNQNLTLDASGLSNGISINGNNAGRVFEVSNATVVLNSLAITNGEDNKDINDTSGGGGGIFIYSGNLTLNNCTVAGNSATNSWGGGGIYINSGNLTLNNCTVAGNSANDSWCGGGGIYNNGTMTLNQCTLSGNSANDVYGGGIYNNGTMSLIQCTLSGNSATNSGAGGGGILNGYTLTLYNSIVAGNSPDNLDGDGTTTPTGVNLTRGDPLLAPLGSYGGPTQTMPPLAGSPAIDGCTNGTTFTTDQRGFPRILGPFADIGAVESQYGPVVASAADSGENTLRAAIASAPAGSTIFFAPALSGATILLTHGQITLNQNLTLDASALSNGISINGNNAGRVFEVSNATVVLNSLTITNGEDNNDNNDRSGGGGGIFIFSGNLTLNNCTVAGNSANNSICGGGGIFNCGSGTLTLNNCIVAGNSANYSGVGGGILNSGGTLTLNQCTLSGNSANDSYFGGGGLYNFGTLTLNQCTLAGNSANYCPYGGGGGIYNYEAVLTLNQCTLSGNSANYCPSGGGGGIYNDFGTATVNQCTLSGNSANYSIGGGGGGIYHYDGTLTLYNSIVAGNSPDNLDGDGATASTGVNLTNGDPLLAPLGSYGGPTQTMPPLPGSPAIDGCTNGTTFTTDQRGFPRVVGPFADIGAVESGNAIPCLMVNTAVDKNDGLGTDGASLRDAIAYAPAGSTIIFAPALSGATILLTNGQIMLNQILTIDASALSHGLSINGNNAGRIFEVSNATVVLNSLTITNGEDNNDNNDTSGGGGGIFICSGNLTLNNCTVAGNSANNSIDGGGGIDNCGTLTLNQCTLSDNSATNCGAATPSPGGGGGICSFGGTVTVNESTLSGNSANHSGGGGIFNYNGVLTLNQCTLSGNSANNGQGGGGIWNWGTVTVNQCTLSGNSANNGSDGGGIYNNYGTLTLYNSIVAGNSPDNLDDDDSGTTTPTGVNLTSGDPLLAPLGNYGGLTQTMPPLAGSPAIDGCTDGTTFTTDQRGFPRIVGPFADIGAVEYQYGPVVANGADTGESTLRAAIAYEPSGSTITFAPALSGTTITLTSGPLNVPNSVSILGPGPGLLTVSGNNASGVFNVTGANVTISGLTIANGQSTSDGAGLNAAGGPASSLILSNCVVTNNFTTADGGGIYNNANVAMIVSDCIVCGNGAGAWGGGIYNHGEGNQTAVMTVNNSTVTGNSAGAGGGILNSGYWGCSATLTLNSCTVSSNSALAVNGVVNAGDGGGIDNEAGFGGSVTLTVSNCTICGNSASASGGGIFSDGQSGGNASLAVSSSAFNSNSASASGGGIFSDGQSGGNASLAVSSSTFNSNSASASGGGIFSDGESGGNASLTISNSTLSGNGATDWGGGIYNLGQMGGNASLAVWGSTLSGNTASGRGGGIDNDGFSQGQATLVLNTSTLSGNSAGQGGGIYNDGYASGNAAVTINAGTLSGNSASQGGGIYNDGESGGTGTVEIVDTILNAGSGGTLANDLGAIISDGYNLSSDAGAGFLTAISDQINTNPKLGPLANNGGPTLTMLPLFGSPAIDAGADSVTNCLATDQRGCPRCSGAHVDIGAVEAQWAPANQPPLLSNFGWTWTAHGGVQCFQFTFSSAANADFTVLATTNLALPLADWTMLAPVIQCAPGQYQFTDPQATNFPQQFYRVISP